MENFEKNRTSKIIKSFEGKNVFIVGDVMLDVYIKGNVDRISPEAPVQVVLVNNKYYRLGGAANVARNIRSLGAIPHVFSIIGDDVEGRIFRNKFQESSISSRYLITSETRPTTVKTRIMSEAQQLLRIDNEITENIFPFEKAELFQKIEENIDIADVIIFEDYDKGVLSPDLIKKIIILAKQKNIITVVDPKKRNFLSYEGVTLLKPNLKELKEGIEVNISKNFTKNELDIKIKKLFEKLDIDIAFITLSERGVYINNQKESFLIPSHIRNIFDVSGAGDTVISVASLAIAAGIGIKEIAEISNIAGGLVCEEVGVVPVKKEKLIEECKRICET